MNYDLLVDLVFFWFIALLGWGLGFWAGKQDEQEKNRMIADINRIKLAQEKQVYDWKRDGI